MAADTGDKVTRKYKNFRGVDFRGEECSLNRSPDSLNVWRNYKKLSSIETRPGLEHFYSYPMGVRSMMWHENKLYFTSNDGYIHALNSDGSIHYEINYVGNTPVLFKFNGNLYAKGEEDYIDVTSGEPVTPYIPTTRISGKVSLDSDTPSSGGTKHEDVNMLSDYRINTFVASDDDAGYVLWLDTKPIDKDFKPVVTINDSPVTNFQVDYGKGKIVLAEAPPAPNTVGQDNISVKFKKHVDGYSESILKCTMVTEFDNRVFFSGNPGYPSTVWHSSLHDPTYCSDLDYYVDGVDESPIRSMVAGNNGLWVFKDESEANSSVYYHTPTIDSEYGKVYPSSHSSISLGCVGRAINFNDDIVFFSQRGMEGASTDITTEQFVTHRSSLVDRKMLEHPNYRNMILAEWEGYLLVFMGKDVYLADSRAVLTNENHIEYEWYHWNLGRYDVTCAVVHDGVLYIGTGEGHIYSLTREAKNGDGHKDITMPIESYWTTPKDNFGAPNKLKTTNKKGCVVEAIGDVAVSVKTDDDKEYELIGTNEGIDDYFVSRIKRKKFKDIQLKFESKTAFSLEAASLECFIGGYIKR